MAQNNYTRILWILIVFAAVIVGAWFWISKGKNYKFINTITGNQTHISAVTNIGGPFSLVDHKGNERTSKEFKGKYVIMYFGYSFCPDICPMGLNAISEALNLLPARILGDVIPIFITVDPERDTPKRLAQYRRHFHPKFIMLTGSSSQIDQVITNYKVHAIRSDPQDTSPNYLIDHTSLIYVFDRQGNLVAHFNHESNPADISQTIGRLLVQG